MVNTYNVGEINESILLSVKKNLAIPPENTDFDPELIMIINGSLDYLIQLGIGDDEAPFYIMGRHDKWADFPELDRGDVKQLINLRTRLIFDPPNVGSVVSSLNNMIQELTWRITARRDGGSWRERMNSTTTA